MPGHNPEATRRFREARDLLLELRGEHRQAAASFRWPRFEQFNWALDWFDEIAVGNDRAAVRLIEPAGTATQLGYAELSARSNQVANWLHRQGVRFGDRLLLMLDNQFAVWESILAAIKLGVVVIPTFTSVSGRDLADRIERGAVAHVLTEDRFTARFAKYAGLSRFNTGRETAGWVNYASAYRESEHFVPEFETRGSDPLFIYFTSGTTSLPKMVGHTHVSYPVGHLTGMYWNGLMPGDVHANVSAPGWAKHSWSSFFGPFNAEATVLSVAAVPGRPAALIDTLRREEATSLCAPPTAWRMLVQQDLGERPSRLREATSVGEPLNPEVIEQVRRSWGLTVRDGYGQTEATAMVGNTPDSVLKPGSMGRPLPGYDIRVLDEAGRPALEGELCICLADEPVGLMTGYLGDSVKTAAVMAGGHYHTGDVVTRDEDGYLTYVGRTDDVFKSFDHRISPFELESALVEHPLVAEAAVVPVPDPVGMFVPKAFVALSAGIKPSRELARAILEAAGARLAPHQRIAALEFAALPKTTSGKIRRAELRDAEKRAAAAAPGDADPSAPRLAWRTDELLGAVVRAAPGL